MNARSALLVLLTAATVACSTDDTLTGTVRSAAEVGGQIQQVTFAKYGKLGDGMDGYAWVAAGRLATVESPSPCDRSGCFQDTEGGLCTKGTLPALVCDSEQSWNCNYGDNWGVMLGLNPGPENVAWGADAPESVSLTFAGGPGSYRLTAHVAGDPLSKSYCIDGYVSGLSVSANQLTAECWSSGGAPLPSFADVDRIGLLLTSSKAAQSFDFCVSDVTLNARAESGRILVGTNGKLNGAMQGYAWVASGDTATIASPNPCNHNGCFRNTGGTLCTEGSMPALECTGQNTANLECDWATNWGVMIGLNPGEPHAAWGERATEHLAITYDGGPGRYQLNAHVAGDPHQKVYCLRDYRSGQEVTADMLRAECWKDSGAPLRSFADVDSFGLLVASAQTPVEFDYCISQISAY